MTTSMRNTTVIIRSLNFCLWVILLIISPTQSQYSCPDVCWVEPGEPGVGEDYKNASVYRPDETIHMRFSNTIFDNFTLNICQELKDCKEISEVNGRGAFRLDFSFADILRDFDIRIQPIFYFHVVSINGDSTSHYIRIRDPAAEDVSLSSPITTSLPSSVSSTPVVIIHSIFLPQSTTNETIPVPSSSHMTHETGLDSPAKLGVAVGLGLGIPALLTIGILSFLLRLRYRRRLVVSPPSFQGWTKVFSEVSNDGAVHEVAAPDNLSGINFGARRT
ncbi:hypothetical protein EJ05DRAFT_512856 [Pseudovirgaria hyperparasitica]|uniref:Mid2 domain-containing protein n=1 Tax=Pseudovirgaria hyperparasitica TaxID=470096 RepID=A0A6A6VZL7_9PEZI|nr:uncharacterized protein EJ05DRAFT_512856 [Pseudovirgaria hyperparasitica]KAF2755329.1 hypothetical protein EJ05DRAFT_512856 [Pseudovirgaria hyperparasitica]